MPCALGSIPPNIVVNAMSTVVLTVLTHTLMGTRLFIRHNTCHMCRGNGIHSFGSMLCAACFVGKGLVLILVCLGGFSWGGKN